VITFNQAVERFESEFLAAQKPSTRCTMSSEIRAHLRPAFQHMYVDKIRPTHVNKAVNFWREKGLSPKTIRNLLTTLGLVRRHVGLDPFKRGEIILPKKVDASHEERYFSSKEMAAIIKQSSGIFKVLFAMAAGTGMRAGELFGLHVEDVDLEKGIVHVRRSVYMGEEQSPKTQNGYRWIPIDEDLRTMLRAHIARLQPTELAPYLFSSSNGQPLRLSNVLNRELWPILKKLGIPQAGMHAFRHGRVSVLVENNVPAELIRSLIGHGTDDMVRRYTHHRPEYHIKNLPPSIMMENGG
jgi:integrase